MAPITVACKPRSETTSRGGLGMTPSMRFRIGAISISAERETPPPSTTSSGSKEATRFAIAMVR